MKTDTHQAVERYPLTWPRGWHRTAAGDRQWATFRRISDPAVRADGTPITRRPKPLTVPDAIERLSNELARLGATQEILSTNLETRLNGLPRGGQRDPADPGAAVYFTLKGKPLCLACDKWTRVADNIAALAQHIDALRRIERYGVGRLEQAFAGYTALPPDAASDWWFVLGVSPAASDDEIERAFRERARLAHPDAGGSHLEMARLTEARAAARKASR